MATESTLNTLQEYHWIVKKVSLRSALFQIFLSAVKPTVFYDNDSQEPALSEEGTEIILHALPFSLKASSPAITRSGWPKSHCFQWSEIWSLGMFYVNISLHIFFSFVRVIYSFTSPRKVSSQKSYIWCKLKRYCIGAETLYFYQVGIANYNNEINL